LLHSDVTINIFKSAFYPPISMIKQHFLTSISPSPVSKSAFYPPTNMNNQHFSRSCANGATTLSISVYTVQLSTPCVHVSSFHWI